MILVMNTSMKGSTALNNLYENTSGDVPVGGITSPY